MLKVFFVNGVTKFLIEEFLCNAWNTNTCAIDCTSY